MGDSERIAALEKALAETNKRLDARIDAAVLDACGYAVANAIALTMVIALQEGRGVADADGLRRLIQVELARAPRSELSKRPTTAILLLLHGLLDPRGLQRWSPPDEGDPGKVESPRR